MRRLLLASLIVLIGGSTAATELAHGATPVGGSAHAYLEMFSCHRALQPSQRLVSVTAVMRPLSGTVRLNMRFQLLDANGRVVAVRGGDLGTWITPDPITLGQQPNDVWIVRHPVSGIAVPGLYHFRVSFRWTGSGDRTIGSSVRLSLSCWQPDMRPDLLVQSINVEPVAGNTSQDQYVALIENTGLTEATRVEVLFSPAGGSTPQMVTIPKLRAHQTHQEVFVGPACTSGAPPTVTVDPDHHINELDPSDNSLTASCPTPSAARAQLNYARR